MKWISQLARRFLAISDSPNVPIVSEAGIPNQLHRFLAVSGNPDIRHRIGSDLAPMGLEVAFANSGKSALNMLQAQSFDAYLIDELLPDWDAYTLIRQMPVNSHGRKPPVMLIVPARSDLGWLIEEPGFGPHCSITWPFGRGELKVFVHAMQKVDWTTRDAARWANHKLEGAYRNRLKAAMDGFVMPNQEVYRAEYGIEPFQSSPICNMGEILCFECAECGFLLPVKTPTTMICPCHGLCVRDGPITLLPMVKLAPATITPGLCKLVPIKP